MKAHTTENIRNVAVAGHSDSGKTSLVEAVLYHEGVIERPGSVTAGTTVSDYDPVEQHRGHSVSATLVPVELGELKINLLDLPGRPGFIGEMRRGMRAMDGLLLVINATTGEEVGTEFAWEYSEEFGMKARACFINKMDRERANFRDSLDSLNATFAARAVPVTLPVGAEGDLRGVIDLVRMKFARIEGRKVRYEEIPAEMAAEAAEARAKMVEAAAEGNDELMMKFLDDRPLSDGEVIQGLREAMAGGRMMPVVCGSAETLDGIAALLALLENCFPDPVAGHGLPAGRDAEGEAETFRVTPEGPTRLYVFKTVSDPYAGHLSFFKVMSGSIGTDAHLTNLTTGKQERIAHVQTVCGKKHENIASLAAGDIGAATKLDGTRTGDTLAGNGATDLVFRKTPMPEPVMHMAVVAVNQADEDKIGIAFHRLIEQDPTLRLYRDPEINQTILAGMGPTHLDVAVEHLRETAKVKVELKTPRVPYRETITKKAEGQGKYKKQSGGRGQYGDVWIRFEPLPEGSGFEFAWGIVGGAVPTKYQPSVEKGLAEAMERGLISGHRVTDLKATAYDGSFHAVDSSDMAFQVAASLAFKNVAVNAAPVILEPIWKLRIRIPESCMGDVMGDLNSRRGRIQGMEDAANRKEITAQAPLAEIFNYARDLRSMSHGAGLFEMEFDHYARVPADVQEKIVAAREAEDEEG